MVTRQLVAVLVLAGLAAAQPVRLQASAPVTTVAGHLVWLQVEASAGSRVELYQEMQEGRPVLLATLPAWSVTWLHPVRPPRTSHYLARCQAPDGTVTEARASVRVQLPGDRHQGHWPVIETFQVVSAPQDANGRVPIATLALKVHGADSVWIKRLPLGDVVWPPGGAPRAVSGGTLDLPTLRLGTFDLTTPLILLAANRSATVEARTMVKAMRGVAWGSGGPPPTSPPPNISRFGQSQLLRPGSGEEDPPFNKGLGEPAPPGEPRLGGEGRLPRPTGPPREEQLPGLVPPREGIALTREREYEVAAEHVCLLRIFAGDDLLWESGDLTRAGRQFRQTVKLRVLGGSPGPLRLCALSEQGQVQRQNP